MEVKHTPRGFEYIDLAELGCLQQSSAIGEYDNASDYPGSSFLWFDKDHLNREDVRAGLKRGIFPADCVPHVESWLASGSLVLGATPFPPTEESLVEKLYDLGCVMWSECSNASDYVCRYCGNRTRTNVDHSINHDSTCLWLEIEEARNEEST